MLGLFLACILTLPLSVCIGTEFPQRPVRVVVYTGPGGLLDVMARKFVEVARRYTSATLYVENRPGAGGIVAFDGVVQGSDDGYTILAVTKSNVAKLLMSQRHDLLDAIDWRAILVVDPECLIVTQGSGLKSVADLELEARLTPNKLQNWLGPAVGGLDHVTAAKIWDQRKIQGQWIPYTSGGEAISALLGGQGRIYVGNPSDAASNPDLKILAVSSPHRLNSHPDVPTLREVGMIDLDRQYMWRGFALKRGCPEESLRWLDRLCEQVAHDVDWQAFWRDEGAQVSYRGPEQTARQVTSDRAEFTDFHRRLGLSDETSQTVNRSTVWGNFVRVAILALIGWIPSRQLLFSRVRAMRTSDWLIPALLQGLFACLYWQLSSLRHSNEFGAASLPRLWLTCGMVLSPLMVTRSLGKNDSQTPRADEVRWVAVMGFMAITSIYFVGLATLGFYSASALGLIGMMWWLGYRRWTMIAIIAVWLLLIHGGLERTLHVPMPRGWWES